MSLRVSWTHFNVSLILSSYIQKDLEGLDDASTELMMASGDKVMLMAGEGTFIGFPREFFFTDCFLTTAPHNFFGNNPFLVQRF